MHRAARNNFPERYRPDPLDYCSTENPFFLFGWPKSACPDFDAIKAAAVRPPKGDESPQQRKERLRKRIAQERTKGTKAFLEVVAKEEGRSVSRLKQLIATDTSDENSWTTGLAPTKRQTSSRRKKHKY